MTNLRSLIRRSRVLFTGHGRYNANDRVWRGLPGDREVEFGAAQYEDDVFKHQGHDHDGVFFDEVVHFTESQFWFLTGWNRTTIPGQRCRVVMTFNPPTKPSERWIIPFFGPWLDRKHPHPAAPGELRWFARIDGKDVERPDGRPFEHVAEDGRPEVIRPLSRTFFPASLADNPALASTNYGATLQSLPEPLRSQLLYGDFDAGIEDGAWQAIPTAWVEAAMRRWVEMGGDDYVPDQPMHCMGMDVAHGGADSTVLAPRHAAWFARLLEYSGRETPEGKDAAAVAYRAWSPGALVNVDAIGYGASAYERLVDLKVPCQAINSSERSEYTDRSGKYRMINRRAEAYWRLRDALDPESKMNVALPDDPQLLADLTAPSFEITVGGIKIEPKPIIARRIGRSPDRGDAVAYAVLPLEHKPSLAVSVLPNPTLDVRWGSA